MDLEALAARYAEVTQAQEAELLKRLNDEGWEAGCWIRPGEDLIVKATPAEVLDFFDAMSKRARPPREVFEDYFPDGLPWTPIDGTDPCYIVLSQRCDIVAPLKTEPLVELAPAIICANKGDIGNAWRNSARSFPVDPRGDESNPTHLVDLRYRFFISKLDLIELPVTQSLPGDDCGYRVRERFALRLGQRYTRSAIPDKLVAGAVGPLFDLIKGDEELNQLFIEWGLYHGGNRDQPPGVVAVYVENIDDSLPSDEQERQRDELQRRAEDKFQDVINALPAAARALLDLDDDRRTLAVSEAEHSVARWRLSWKLELDEESFGGNSDAAPPAR